MKNKKEEVKKEMEEQAGKDDWELMREEMEEEERWQLVTDTNISQAFTPPSTRDNGDKITQMK